MQILLAHHHHHHPHPTTTTTTTTTTTPTTTTTTTTTTRSRFGGTLVSPGTAAARLCRSQLRVASTPSHGWCGRSPMGW